ncbi:MAG TPA: response regulator [Planktothrix sp.]|jgi:CheY-like chemotaxis protein
MNPIILVVEDNPAQQLVIRELCERFDYAVEVVASGEAALKALERQPFALVALDLVLPGMSGIECAKIIRQREQAAGHRTPIIGITAYSSDEDRALCLASGIDDYLAKPFEPEALRTILLRWAYQSSTRPNLKLLMSNESAAERSKE